MKKILLKDEMRENEVNNRGKKIYIILMCIIVIVFMVMSAS